MIHKIIKVAQREYAETVKTKTFILGVLMTPIIKVAQREYAETVKTKTFILGVLMTPLIIGGIIYFSSRYAHSDTGPRAPKQIAIMDQTGELAHDIRNLFDKYNAEHKHQEIHLVRISSSENLEEQIQQEKDRVRKGHLNAYVVLETEILSGQGKMQFYTRDTKASDLDYISTVEHLINQAVVNKRCQRENVDPQLLKRLWQDVSLQQIAVGTKEDRSECRRKRKPLRG